MIGTNALRRIAATAALVLVALAVSAGTGCRPDRSDEPPARRDPAMLKLTVTCERSDYVPGNDVRLDLRLTNAGEDAVEITDPQDPSNAELEYVVSGPKWPSGRTFTRRSAAAESETGKPGAPKSPVRVAAGATWQTRVSLSRVADLSAPGEYRVRVRLMRPGGDTVESDESVFRIGAGQAGAIHLAVGLSDTRGQGEGALVVGGELHTFEFQEGSPEISEADVGAVVHRGKVGNATDVSIPARNTPFFDELVRWVVWLDDASVKALRTMDKTPLSVALPGEAACLVQPALRTKGGPVEVLALARDRRAVSLARFDRIPGSGGGLAGPAAGTLAWTAALPGEARSAVAALGPVTGGSERHLAFAAETTAGIEVFHARFAEAGLAGAFDSVRVERTPAPRLVASSTPALHVDGDGVAWASFLALAGDRALWIEARFPGGGTGAPEVNVTDLGAPGATPSGGAVVYATDAKSAIVRRDVALLLDGGQLVRWDGKALVDVQPRGTPTRPLLLVAGKSVTYLLAIDADRGPHLEPL